jgi:hypothetical protein
VGPMLRRTWVQTLPALVAACAAFAATSANAGGATTPPSASRAAASTAFCAKLGATGSVVRKIFGAGATPSDTKGSSTYCQITPANAPTTGPTPGCSGVECTDVFISGAKSAFASTVAGQVAELKQFGGGHVSKRAVAGAGAGAVLVTDTHYGDPSEGLGPVLFLQAGSHTIAIQGSLGGPPVFSQWEKLARAVHSRLG